jgi:hypothetical protein
MKMFMVNIMLKQALFGGPKLSPSKFIRYATITKAYCSLYFVVFIRLFYTFLNVYVDLIMGKFVYF